MKLEPFHLYLEAFGLLAQKCGITSFSELEQSLRNRVSNPELAGRLLAPCREMLEACADISLPDSPLFRHAIPQDGVNARPFQNFFLAYYDPRDSRPVRTQMLDAIRREGVRNFLSCFLEEEENCGEDCPDGEALLKRFHEEPFTPEGRSVILETALFPEIYAAQLAELLERIAGRIAPILQKHRDKFRYAEEFVAAPDLNGRMRERVHVQIPEDTILYPSLSAFNFGLAYRPASWDRPYFILGILFCGVDVFCPQKLSGEQIAGRLKLLGDATKLEILRILGEGPAYQTELAKRLKLTTPTVSHHMNLLMQGGFITDEMRDNRVYYHLNRKGFAELADNLNRHLGWSETR